MKAMLTRGPTAGTKTFFVCAAVVLCCLALFSGCKPGAAVRGKNQGPQELVMPSKGAYTGAYVDFGEGEDHVTYDAITAFEKMTGKHLAVVAFGNFWGNRPSP